MAQEGDAQHADVLGQAWRERIERAEDPTEFVQEFSDDALVILLETAGDDRATERNLVLAETLRRISGRPRGGPHGRGVAASRGRARERPGAGVGPRRGRRGQPLTHTPSAPIGAG